VMHDLLPILRDEDLIISNALLLRLAFIMI